MLKLNNLIYIDILWTYCKFKELIIVLQKWNQYFINYELEI